MTTMTTTEKATGRAIGLQLAETLHIVTAATEAADTDAMRDLRTALLVGQDRALWIADEVVQALSNAGMRATAFRIAEQAEALESELAELRGLITR
jgi:electron transfer flavoprotein alpha/beta subunit